MNQELLTRIGATNKPYKLYTDVTEDQALLQFAECMEQSSVVQGALMPDTHAGYVAPIGSVIKTKDTIFPSFVGYDIGCGMSECLLELQSNIITKYQWQSIRDEILNAVPIGFNRHETNQNLSDQLCNLPITDFSKQILTTQGHTQIGTLGGGNHFIELGSNKDGNLSIVIHSGSRGVGHKIAEYHMKVATVKNIDKECYINEFNSNNQNWYNAISEMSECVQETHQEKYASAQAAFVYRKIGSQANNIEKAYPLVTTTQEGQNYINDMNMALQFALDNRKLIIDNIVKAITTVTGKEHNQLRFINRNHNHAELVDGYWIHRKGATHAAEGMPGVIPGNMVDGSFIVVGKGDSDSMCSSSHGAGRVLSRTQAKAQLSLVEFQECTKHLIANHSDQNLDEAPKAYKSIYEVMDNQKDLVTVIDKITPILNVKG